MTGESVASDCDALMNRLLLLNKPETYFGENHVV